LTAVLATSGDSLLHRGTQATALGAGQISLARHRDGAISVLGARELGTLERQVLLAIGRSRSLHTRIHRDNSLQGMITTAASRLSIVISLRRKKNERTPNKSTKTVLDTQKVSHGPRLKRRDEPDEEPLTCR
jgi:hypothetical protein